MSFSSHLYAICVLFVCQSYVLACLSYVIRMSLVCNRMLFVCHSYVFVNTVCTCMPFVCHSCVLVWHLYVTHMSLVCHSYVLVCYPYATRIYSYAIGMSLICGFTMNRFFVLESLKRNNKKENDKKKTFKITRKNYKKPLFRYCCVLQVIILDK